MEGKGAEEFCVNLFSVPLQQEGNIYQQYILC